MFTRIFLKSKISSLIIVAAQRSVHVNHRGDLSVFSPGMVRKAPRSRVVVPLSTALRVLKGQNMAAILLTLLGHKLHFNQPTLVERFWFERMLKFAFWFKFPSISLNAKVVNWERVRVPNIFDERSTLRICVTIPQLTDNKYDWTFDIRLNDGINWMQTLTQPCEAWLHLRALVFVAVVLQCYSEQHRHFVRRPPVDLLVGAGCGVINGLLC